MFPSSKSAAFRTSVTLSAKWANAYASAASGEPRKCLIKGDTVCNNKTAPVRKGVDPKTSHQL